MCIKQVIQLPAYGLWWLLAVMGRKETSPALNTTIKSIEYTVLEVKSDHPKKSMDETIAQHTRVCYL